MIFGFGKKKPKKIPAAEAYAKINLTLHITGQREDGYHLLDSLVHFFESHDLIEFKPAETRDMSVGGDFADGVPTGPDNLIWKAVELIAPDEGLEITLHKYLPHGAGIGSGSSDAAAALRALRDAWGLEMPDTEALLSLGADVPVCVRGDATRMEGIGEVLSDAPELPELVLLLVNPGIHVPTGKVFGKLENKNNPPMDPMEWTDFDSFITWCAAQRNDLQAPAIAVAPEIATVLAQVEALDGCHLARMSGSGSTCFGIFQDLKTAMEAGETLRANQPDWWIEPGYLGFN